jgi:hypothetical protein
MSSFREPPKYTGFRKSISQFEKEKKQKAQASLPPSKQEQFSHKMKQGLTPYNIITHTVRPSLPTRC